MKIIEIDNLKFSYVKNSVLKGLDFSLYEGELVILIGANGSGKSTLIKLILGELEKDSGSIKVFNEDIETFTDFGRVGYVPQIQVANEMAFPITCLELVALNLYRNFGFIKIADKESKARAEEALIDLGLKDYIHTPISELSGGLKQRAMIARAIVNEPDLLILDEPTAGIDDRSKENLLDTINAMHEKKGISMICITHELDYMEERLKEYRVVKVEGGKAKTC